MAETTTARVRSGELVEVYHRITTAEALGHIAGRS